DLAAAADEVRLAGNDMADASATLDKAQHAQQSMTLQPAIDSEGKAIEHLENALKLLQPPPKKQDQKKQQDQQQQPQQQQQPHEGQSIQDAVGTDAKSARVAWVCRWHIRIAQPGAGSVPQTAVVRGSDRATAGGADAEGSDIPKTEAMKLGLSLPDRPVFVGE